MKKRILITAGGTATAWHMSNIIKKYFSDEIELHICDINPPELVASSINADKFHRVMPIANDGYRASMLDLLKRERIDYIIPLIDWDLFMFPEDDEELKCIGTLSMGPQSRTAKILSDKKKMCDFLTSHGIPTPRVWDVNGLDNETMYVVKPQIGCGSKGFKILSGKEIRIGFFESDSYVIQELCDDGGEEITAEIFNACDKIEIFCRVRIETKEGVCTKMRHVNVPEINETIKRLISILPMPTAFCVQFMRHRGVWNIIDCNLRIGAGTALSTASGFQLTRAFFANILGKEIDSNWFTIDPEIKAVVRVYKEEVMR